MINTNNKLIKNSNIHFIMNTSILKELDNIITIYREKTGTKLTRTTLINYIIWDFIKQFKENDTDKTIESKIVSLFLKINEFKGVLV